MNKSLVKIIILCIASLQLFSGCSINFSDNEDENAAVSSSVSNSEKDNDEKSSIDDRKSEQKDNKNDDTKVNITIQNNNDIQDTPSSKSNIVDSGGNSTNSRKKVQGKDKWYAEFERLKSEEKREKANGGDGMTVRQIQAKYTKAWDDDLNAIWGELKTGLDSNLFKDLTKDEIKWIKYKENYVKQKIDEQWPDKNNRNAWTACWENTYIEEKTIERCYYLVDNYMY